jgi:hypothetical protein
MTCLAIVLFGRLMNNPGLKCRGLFRMALGARAAHLGLASLRCRPASRDEKNHSETNQAKFP